MAIIGSVNEPGIYEIKGDETVASALEDAGGATNLADQDRVLLERIENHEGRQSESFAIDEDGMKRMLRDGDLLRVYPLSPRFDNAVTLRGNVAQPGRYAWRDGMRVSDLIPNRQFLLTRDYWNQQNFLVPERIAHPFGLAPDQFDPQTGTNVQNPANAPTGVNPKTNSTRRIGFNPQAGHESADRKQHSALQNGQPATNTQPGNNPQNGINPQTGMNAQNGGNQQTGTNQQTEINTQNEAIQRSETSFAAARNSEEINWDYAAIERLDQHDLSTRLIAFNLA